MRWYSSKSKKYLWDGYRILMVCIEVSDFKKATGIMKQIAPSCKFVDVSGGSLLFSIPLDFPKEIAPLFKLINRSNNSDSNEIKLES